MLLSAVRLARAALRLQPCRACSSWGSRSQCSSADPACHPRCRNMQLFSASLAMQRCSDHRWSCSKCNFQNKSSCSARAAATQPLLQWHCPCCTGTALLLILQMTTLLIALVAWTHLRETQDDSVSRENLHNLRAYSLQIVTWDSSRTVVVLKLRRTSAL